jgi:Fur family transcriptional regulator, peroxide stress response regulator
MTDPASRYEYLIAKLRQRHFRLTPQRMALVRMIAASDGHPSAHQLYEQVKSQYPTMSPATVYKTLNLFKEMGEVFEIDLKDNSRYDGNKPHPHPHVICISCQKVIDGADEPVNNLLDEIESDSGYKIVRHQIIFYGYCPDCQASGQM